MWASTQAQIDYRYGVVRRGLFGEICRVLHVPVADYRVFSAIALLLLAVLLTLMFRLMSQSGINDMAEGSLIALIASSFWLAYLVNLVGYFDIILALLALTVISIRRAWAQALAAIALGSFGVLFHEIYLFAFLPVSLLGLVHWSERRKWRLWLPLFCAVVPACVTLWVVGHHLRPEQVEAFRFSIHEQSNSAVMDRFFEIFTRNTRESLRDTTAYMRAPYWWFTQAVQGIQFLPVAAFLLAVSFRILGPGWRLTKTYAVLAVLSPLTLYFTGLDWYRWMTLCTLSAILVLITLARIHGTVELGLGWQQAAIFLTLIGMASNSGMFDGGHPFPLLDQIEWVHIYLREAANH
jgi:hypothetical protein